MTWGNRSGREPRRARSPLKLRRVIAVLGAVVCLAGSIAIWATDGPRGPVAILLVAAILGLGDAAVITGRLRRR